MKTTLLYLLIGIGLSFSQTNFIDNYRNNTITSQVIASSNEFIAFPQDLDFKPNTNELWVANKGNFDISSIVIIYDAGTSNQTFERRRDSHSSHFNELTTAIAFGDNGMWASVSEMHDSFMGPSLWSSDTNIFARIFQNNWQANYPLGSHLDMLHQSPMSMGIAHDTLMAYWVLDGENGNVCKYDYVKHHSPGYDDHSAGKIWRYTDVNFNRKPNISSHIVLDKKNNWLYFVDGQSKTIKRMKTDTGSITGNLTTTSEPLAGYYQVEGATVEVIDTLLTQPSGIEFYDGRLLVSDFTNGNIYMYDMENQTYFRDTIVTNSPGIMGIKVGFDGHIWYVNKTENEVVKLIPATPQLDASISKISNPLTENYSSEFYSLEFNYCESTISPIVKIKNNGQETINNLNLKYKTNANALVETIWNGSILSGQEEDITLNESTTDLGINHLQVEIASVNGVLDEITTNNNFSSTFRNINSPYSLPFIEDFSDTSKLPFAWNYLHYNPHNKISNNLLGSFDNQNGIGSLKMDNFSSDVNISGQVDYLVMPALNLNVGNSILSLEFNYSYAKYDASSKDSLVILLSSDCGNTWLPILEKSGDSLITTTTFQTTEWIPTGTDWKKAEVDLSNFNNLQNALICFKFISNWGNNVYIDDVKISDLSASVIESNNENFILFPNPTSGETTIYFNKYQNKVVYNLYNISGHLVKENQNIQGKESKIDLSNIPAGIYFLDVKTENGNEICKIIKEN